MQRDNELTQEAYINLKAGDFAAARRYAERALMNADDIETRIKASFILSQVSDDPKEKRALLETVLAYDMHHAEARRALAILDGKLKPEDIINADNLPAQSSDPQKARADRFTCPRCGARRVFAPDGRALVCEHCGYNDSLANNAVAGEEDFFIAMATSKGHRKPVATQVFHCKGCGAEFVLAPGVISATCAYCDSPHVVRLDQSRDLLEPDAILPHVLTQKQAVKFLVQWVEENKLKPTSKVDLPRGAYVPLWTFDLGGAIRTTGYTYEVDENILKKEQRRLVKVSEDAPVLVNDLLIPASKKMAARLRPLLHTFNLSAVQPYDTRFLANWPAEIYDISMSDASLNAREIAYADYRQRLRAEFSHLEDLSMSSAGMSIESFKLVLLPVWMTEIPLGAKKIEVLMNGQNGNVVSTHVNK